jgi:three-Cys-motif partner protein
VRYIFVEKDPEALDYLRGVLNESRYAQLVGDRIHLIQGEFTAQVSEIMAFVKKRGRADRAIFVLDQFGYTDVPLPTIRSILATLDNAEVILTFATDFLIDYLNEFQFRPRQSAPRKRNGTGGG